MVVTTSQLNADLYDFTQNLQGSLWTAALTHYNTTTDHPRPTPPVLLQLRAGYAESPGWYLVQAAEFDPEPLTVDRLRVRAIWSAPSLVAALLELMASEQWLDRRGTEYHLTATGRAILDRSNTRRVDALSNFHLPIPAARLDRLAALLTDVIDLSLRSPTPPGTWCLRYSHRRAPSETAPALLRIFYAFTDLNAFRDDSHMASWRDHHIEGYVWETFSHVIRGTAATATSLFEQLAYRGHSREDFAVALSELASRAWITVKDNQALPTEQGHGIHATAEQHTNDYFYAPWMSLGDDTLQELLALLHELNMTVNKTNDA
jgi:hypothetical protein